MPDDLRELAAKLLDGIKHFDRCGKCDVMLHDGYCHWCMRYPDTSRDCVSFTGDRHDLERLLRAIAEPKEI